jgi:hypothetical protein
LFRRLSRRSQYLPFPQPAKRNGAAAVSKISARVRMPFIRSTARNGLRLRKRAFVGSKRAFVVSAELDLLWPAAAGHNRAIQKLGSVDELQLEIRVMCSPGLEVELELAAPLLLSWSVGDDDLDRVIDDLVGHATPAVGRSPVDRRGGLDREVERARRRGSRCIMACSRSQAHSRRVPARPLPRSSRPRNRVVELSCHSSC